MFWILSDGFWCLVFESKCSRSSWQKKNQPYNEVCCFAYRKHSQLSARHVSCVQLNGELATAFLRLVAQKGSRGNSCSSHCLIKHRWGEDNMRNGEILAFNAWLWTLAVAIFLSPFSPFCCFFLLRLLDHNSETQIISYGISLQCLIQWYSEYSLIFHLVKYKLYYCNKFCDYKETSIISVLSQLKFLCCIIPRFSSLLVKIIYNKCDVKLQRNPKQYILCWLTAKNCINFSIQIT